MKPKMPGLDQRRAMKSEALAEIQKFMRQMMAQKKPKKKVKDGPVEEAAEE